MPIEQASLFTVAAGIRRECNIDEIGGYRYSLIIRWDDSLPLVGFCMLNPSDANGQKDDPTSTRVIGFSKRWGYGGAYLFNLFTKITSDPKHLKWLAKRGEDVTRYADGEICKAILAVDKVIAAWGADGNLLHRADAVRKLITNDFRIPLYHLGLNQDGSPKHPLYLRADTLPTLWTPHTAPKEAPNAH